MTAWVRDLLFGNWRNKGIALFFAVTIWFVAFQSEKQEYGPLIRVDIKSSDPETTLITSVKRTDVQTQSLMDFDGRVRFLFSGPRKQIDKLRQDPPSHFTLQVSREKSVHTFRESDFGFPRDGVEVLQFFPESIQIVQEEAATMTFKNMAEKVLVTDYKEGFEVATREVEQAVVITAPASIIDRLGVVARVSMEHILERFEGKVDVEVVPEHEDIPPELLRRSVRVTPPQVNVTIVLRATMEVLPVEAMRVTFRVPPVQVPIRILLDDGAAETIPVELHGRKDEIARLKDRLRTDPGFSLGVRVPTFDRKEGGQFTFTEDSLELPGFPGVQIRQHESRKNERKVAWSYTVIPVKEASK